MKPFILDLADARADLPAVGGKGMSLARLTREGLPVPDGFHVTTEAYRKFVDANRLQPRILAALKGADPMQPSTLEAASHAVGRFFADAAIPTAIGDAIRSAYESLRPPAARVAVRSSATAEDLPGASFAGQQETYLNVRGAEAVLEAVRKCWASLWTGRAIAYRLRQGIPPESVALAVVVQLLVPAEAAGILFTANPLTGNRSEAVINAAWGLGEAIVGGAVTPDTIAADKPTGRVLRRETAVKQVMTVRTDAGTEVQPVPDALKKRAALNDRQASELTRCGARIEALYGMPMDIEWALARGRFAILQARPITALPEAPIEWIRPDPKGVYMRGSIVDILPDPLSPLFATLGIPTIARVGVKEVLRPLTRSEPMLPDYILTINGYAYIAAAFTPRQWLWILTRMLFSFPRIIREALPLWRDKIRPHYAAVAARWQGAPLEEMTSAALWGAVQEVNDAAMLHMASLLVATTGASAGAEMLFTRVYEKMVRGEDDPPAPAFVMGYDSIPILAEKSLYDLAAWAKTEPDLAASILEMPAGDLAGRLRSSPKTAAWKEFAGRLQAHLETYGHLIYDLDFAKILPLDDPVPMLETIKMYLRDEGSNPHERQRRLETQRIQAAEATLRRLKGFRAWAFRKTLGMAQTMSQVRENALSDIGLGYPVLRRMLHELGCRLMAAEAIDQAGDVYWLERGELDWMVAALDRAEKPESFAERVEQRRSRWQQLKEIAPPPMLPPRKRYMGIDMADFTARAAESQTGGSLKGVSASPGKVTAAACVLHGPQDFGRMKPGAVLVAATTTPAWTPLFAMATAVVTDIGGPLSHGSIVAREYGIPAVMGTGVATRRIRDGQVVRVDGGAGTVEILEHDRR
jgi:pyruvate,water dikinase